MEYEHLCDKDKSVHGFSAKPSFLFHCYMYVVIRAFSCKCVQGYSGKIPLYYLYMIICAKKILNGPKGKMLFQRVALLRQIC